MTPACLSYTHMMFDITYSNLPTNPKYTEQCITGGGASHEMCPCSNPGFVDSFG